MQPQDKNIRESSLLKAFIKECQSLGINSSSKILLAVSGGIDSIVMATLFWAGGYKIAVAHVNFKLRGDDSNEDQKFVKNWAAERGIQLFEKEADTIEYAKKRGLSVEMAAREIRYEWFYQIAEKENFKYIAIAHNANDNAETLLLNLARGTGLKGLCAISQKNEIRPGLTVARPLLFAQRSDIEAFAQEFGIAYREDRTNKENEYKRNKIRNQVLPLLKELNPSIIKTLNEDISHFKKSYAFEKENVARIMSESLKGKITGLDFIGLREKYLLAAVDLERLFSSNAAGKEDAIKHILCSYLGDYGFSYDVAEEIADSALDIYSHKENCGKISHTTKVFRSAAAVAALERGGIRIYKSDIEKDALALADVTAAIPSVGEWVVNFASRGNTLKRYRLTISEEKEMGSKGAHALYIDAESIKFPLTLRALRTGDAFSPFGLKGSKSVADFLGDKKVDTLIKPFVMALCDSSGKIVCIPGIEIDNTSRVKSTDSKCLCISLSAE